MFVRTQLRPNITSAYHRRIIVVLLFVACTITTLHWEHSSSRVLTVWPLGRCCAVFPRDIKWINQAPGKEYGINLDVAESLRCRGGLAVACVTQIMLR